MVHQKSTNCSVQTNKSVISTCDEGGSCFTDKLTAAATISVVCQYTRMQNGVKLHLWSCKKRSGNSFKIEVMPQKPRWDFSLSPLQPPRSGRGDKSWVFLLSWGSDWARGQTSKTDENKRLSGGPLKENCRGGTGTFMSCLCGSTGSNVLDAERSQCVVDGATMSVYQGLNTSCMICSRQLHKHPLEVWPSYQHV